MTTSELIQAAATVLAETGEQSDHVSDVLYIIGESKEPNGLALVLSALKAAVDEATSHANDPEVGIVGDETREELASAQYYLRELISVLS